MLKTARAGHRDDTRLLFPDGKNLFHRADRQQRPDGQHGWAGTQLGDPVERGQRVIRQFAHCRIHRERCRCEQERIAVGRGARDDFGADDAFRAGAVIDHDLLAESLREVVRDVARHDVVTAAGRLRHEQADRPRRKLRFRGRRGHRDSSDQQ